MWPSAAVSTGQQGYKAEGKGLSTNPPSDELCINESDQSDCGLDCALSLSAWVFRPVGVRGMVGDVVNLKESFIISSNWGRVWVIGERGTPDLFPGETGARVRSRASASCTTVSNPSF